MTRNKELMRIKELPENFKDPVGKAMNLLLSHCKDTRGIVVIGSVADDLFSKSSDIDLVWIKSYPIGYKKLFKIEKDLEQIRDLKIQLVPYTTKKIRWHFQQSTTMARSIQKGIIIFRKGNGLMSLLLQKRLSLPSREWMKNWFEHWLTMYHRAKESIRREKGFHKKYCTIKCICTFFDDIARVTVNFAILYLETRWIIPLSKRQIRDNFKKCLSPSSTTSLNVLKGLNLALKISGRDRFLSPTEVNQILISANWLKNKLSKELQQEEML